jgi:hypothetical protein
MPPPLDLRKVKILKSPQRHDGFIDIVFGTDASTDLDYVVRIDFARGRVRGKLYRCTSPDCSSWSRVGSTNVTRPDRKMVQSKVSRAAIKATGSQIFWSVQSAWGSASCPTGCFDAAPNSGASYDL